MAGGGQGVPVTQDERLTLISAGCDIEHHYKHQRQQPASADSKQTKSICVESACQERAFSLFHERHMSVRVEAIRKRSRERAGTETSLWTMKVKQCMQGNHHEPHKPLMVGWRSYELQLCSYCPKKYKSKNGVKLRSQGLFVN